jgi:hypothetical protein
VVEQRLGPQHERHGEGGREWGAVDERDPLLGPELIGRDAPGGQGAVGGHGCAVGMHEPVTDERLEQVRERDDLAGGAADSARHDRVPRVVQPVDDELAEVRADAGVPAEEPGQPQQHRAADDRLGQRRARAGGASGQDRPLERGLIRRRDGDGPRGHETKPGDDPVGTRAGGQVGEKGVAAVMNRVEQPVRHRHRHAIERDPAVQGQVELIVALKHHRRFWEHLTQVNLTSWLGV